MNYPLLSRHEMLFRVDYTYRRLTSLSNTVSFIPWAVTATIQKRVCRSSLS